METSKRTGLRSSTRNELRKTANSTSTGKNEQCREKPGLAKYTNEEKRKVKKVIVETVIPVEKPSVIKHVDNCEEESKDQEHLGKDASMEDVDLPEAMVEESQSEAGLSQEVEMINRTKSDTENELQEKDQVRQEKDDVLSVVIQKLTELVKSSESLCSRSKELNRSECSSGTSTPPKAVESKKKPRKRRHKSQLYKCPNCPCLFAIRKRDLKKDRKILCACCEKLKQAKAEATQGKLERDSTPLQVVPLESWKVVCEVCSQWVSDYTSLLYHLASHNDVQIFKCKLCDFVTTKKGNIESHQATHRPREINNKFVCSLCKFATNNFGKMEEHLKSHDHKKLLVLKCSVCGYTCRSEEVLRYHMVTHIIEPTTMKVTRKSGSAARIEEEDDMVFKCTVCGYSCDKLSTLKSHSWRHAGDQGCSYPVEESDDEMPEDTNSIPKQLLMGSEVQMNSGASPLQGDGRSGGDEEGEVNSKDLSRLAIGCCSSKGQPCCSKDASGKCQCKSIDVPEAQQPVLEVILNEIENKTADTVHTDKDGIQATQGENGKDLPKEKMVQVSEVTAEVVNKPQADMNKTKPKEGDHDKVEDVLEECSTLIIGLCDKAHSVQERGACGAVTCQEETLHSNDDERLIDDEACGSHKERPHSPPREDANIREDAIKMGGEDGDGSTKNLLSANDDESIIVVVESMGIGSFLDDTASVVEVTTTEEPQPVGSPSLQKEDMKIAIKRLLTPSPSGESSAKKLAKDDSEGISKLLLNVVEDLVEKPKYLQGEAGVSGKKIQCPFCNEELSSFVNLKRHLLDHCQEEILHSCPSCPGKFTTEKLLISHQKERVGTELACNSSQATPLNAGELQQSQTEQVQVVNKPSQTCTEGTGASTNRKCSMCGRKFRTKASLYLHEQECTTKKKVFPCIECDFAGSSRKELNDHLSESHKKPFKCALCEYTSATPSGIKNHMKFHAVDKPYKCNLCNFSGAYPQSLRSHLKVHANADLEAQPPCEQYKCKLCGYISCHLPSMKSHMWRHARDPGFDYNMVEDVIKDTSQANPHGKAVTSQENMIYITNLPNVAMPTQKNMGKLSGQPDSTKVQVTKEMPITTPSSGSAILIYKCTQCGFQSNSEGSLIEHLRGHLAV